MKIVSLNPTTMNLIVEYMSLPNSDVYKKILFEKIKNTELGLEALESQQNVLQTFKTLSSPEIPSSASITITEKLQKIKSKKQISSASDIAYKFLATLKTALQISLVTIGAFLIGVGTIAYFVNPEKNIQNNNISSPAFTTNINSTLSKTSNTSLNFQGNITLDSIKSFDLEKNENPQNLKENSLYAFQGELKKYKAITKDSESKDVLEVLQNAEKELDKSFINTNKIDNYIYYAVLSQHDVKILSDEELD